MYDTARDQAITQLRGVADMVAALTVDYDRLAELREARSDYDGTDNDWENENPDEADELEGLEEAAGECIDMDEAQQVIADDALSCEVRSGWGSPYDTLTAAEYKIVLCTGGPHVELRGTLDAHGMADHVYVRYVCWGVYGELSSSDYDYSAALRYAQEFFMGN